MKTFLLLSKIFAATFTAFCIFAAATGWKYQGQPPQSAPTISATNQTTYAYVSFTSVANTIRYYVYKSADKLYSPGQGAFFSVPYNALLEGNDTEIHNGVTYTYEVQATNDYGVGPMSAPASVTINLDAPSLSLNYTDPTWTLSWNAIAGASGYRIYSFTNSLGSITTSTTTGTSAGAAANTSYFVVA